MCVGYATFYALHGFQTQLIFHINFMEFLSKMHNFQRQHDVDILEIFIQA